LAGIVLLQLDRNRSTELGPKIRISDLRDAVKVLRHMSDFSQWMYCCVPPAGGDRGGLADSAKQVFTWFYDMDNTPTPYLVI